MRRDGIWSHGFVNLIVVLGCEVRGFWASDVARMDAYGRCRIQSDFRVEVLTPRSGESVSRDSGTPLEMRVDSGHPNVC